MARRTKIVATLGPATDPDAALADLVAAGVDLVRVNFSHGGFDDHARRMGERNADKGFGFHLGDAGQQVLAAHAGIYEDRYRAKFEERECDGDEIQTRSEHHQRALASVQRAGQLGQRRAARHRAGRTFAHSR